ncbi:hypothetical protein COO91_04263 [Nostoc flagelliforme CCNUN1]|uniref:Uncharacterized protein n=1 Tax=Nostoc flagelliforme CCNUN1 TaxID=2038116 RepID=A0A2K8SSC3_9NOSO|nr:hypothetical protein [Nostoc flagelliforme]AUB38298.1 hypothetical protein COO91_04263 [Nostoc flagelliforme CCNUN1]
MTTAGIASNNPAQAIELNFNCQGDVGYSAIGSFSYDETTAPTIISERGSGATNFLQSLNVSFLDPLCASLKGVMRVICTSLNMMVESLKYKFRH